MDGTILLMDNSEFQIKKIKYILGSIGTFKFIDITDTAEFYSASDNLDDVSLIILDIAFPTTVEGFEILTVIRGNTITRDIPIIITTKLDKVEYRDQALKFSVSDFIVKPYQSLRLENSVRSLVKFEKKFEYNADHISGINISFLQFIKRELVLADRVKHPLSILLITPVAGSPLTSPSAEGPPKPITALGENTYSSITCRVRSLLRVTDHVSLNDNGDILIVLPATDPAGADVVSEKVKLLLEEELNKIGLPLKDTFCLVTATFPKDGVDFKTLIESCYKKMSTMEMLEKIASIPADTRDYADRKYKQLRKWTLNF